jgi:hypothetical protein
MFLTRANCFAANVLQSEFKTQLANRINQDQLVLLLTRGYGPPSSDFAAQRVP